MSTVSTIIGTTKRGHSRGCPVCGDRNTAAVMVRLSELGPNGSMISGKGSSVARSVSFCDAHAAEFWNELLSVIERKADA